MVTQNVTAIVVAAALILNPILSYSAQPASLNALVDEAVKNNQQVQAAKKRWEASLARVPQARSLENPTIGVTVENIPRGTVKLDKTAPEDRMLSFSQFLPFFGKLKLKGKIALVESQMMAVDYKNTELVTINQVKNSYYELFMNTKEIELLKESLKLLEGVAGAAEASYAVGDIKQEGVYKLHLEIAKLNTDILNLEQEKRSIETRLNALLNREPESALATPELNEDVSFDHDIQSLYDLALRRQPELMIFSYAIERNKHAKSLAKKSFFPDLMATVTQRGIASGAIGSWDIMLSFTAPLWFWTKQRYEVKEAIANLEEAEAAYIVMKNKALSEVKDLTVGIESAKNKINLYKTSLIPILESSIASSMAAYQSGQSEFMMLLDSQRMLVETRMNYYQALVDYNMGLADLERSLGGEFNEVKENEE
ncbi:MAG TPA: TolC family protein [Candidatus Omnitrophota bacterium]|nr:TolC family protein [Candidatus Omnitrophota bacterium]